MTWDANAPVSARQQQWTVEGWDGPFANKTGGETSVETSNAFDGGQKKPTPIAGIPATSNIVLTRPYRPAKHAALYAQWHTQIGEKTVTIAGYDTDPDLGPIGEPETYANALLVRMKKPDYDASSGDPGSMELEFAVSGPS